MRNELSDSFVSDTPIFMGNNHRRHPLKEKCGDYDHLVLGVGSTQKASETFVARDLIFILTDSILTYKRSERREGGGKIPPLESV